MRQIVILISMMFALGLGACSSTESSRSTGQTLDDASITTRVKTAIAQEQGLGEAARINIDTYKGTVSLGGFVDTAEQRQAAAKAASQVQGVDRVVNNLILKKRQ